MSNLRVSFGSEKEIITKLQNGDIFKRKETLLKTKRKIWIEGVTDFCWQSKKSTKKSKCCDIS